MLSEECTADKRENNMSKDVMNLAVAQQLQNFVIKQAQQQQLNISVAVVDSHGELLTFARCDDCALQAGLLAQNKAYTSARDRQPSGNLGKWAQETGKDMGYWTDNKITGLAGGLPIFADNKVIGAIGISGLSEQEDEALAQQAINSVFGV